MSLPASWHNHEGYRAIFNAALSGICANPNFFGPHLQQSPRAAVEFALDVVRAADALMADAKMGGGE
jgi:hypothetical protein